MFSYLRALSPAIVGSALMGASVYGVKLLAIESFPIVGTLIVQIIIGALVYPASLLLLFRSQLKEMLATAREFKDKGT